MVKRRCLFGEKGKSGRKGQKGAKGEGAKNSPFARANRKIITNYSLRIIYSPLVLFRPLWALLLPFRPLYFTYNCGYHYTPKQYFADNPWLSEKRDFPFSQNIGKWENGKWEKTQLSSSPRPICTLPEGIALASEGGDSAHMRPT